MKHIIKKISACLLITVTMLSCSKNSETLKSTGNFAVKSDLYGFKVVPTNSSTAAAFLIGNYDNSSNTFSYTITYRDIVPTAVHIHKGSSVENGPIVFSLTEDGKMNSGAFILSDAQESDLINGLLYIDVHSNFFIDGEIRGQLGKQ